MNLFRFQMLIAIFVFAMGTFSKADLPTGFTKAQLKTVKDGRVWKAAKPEINEKRELKSKLYLFVPNVTAKQYAALVVDYKQYLPKKLIAPLQKAWPIKQEKLVKGESLYGFKIVYERQFFPLEIEGKGEHKIEEIEVNGKKITRISHELGEILNYKEKGMAEPKIAFVKQTTSLYSHDNGVLVEDVVHLKATDNMNLVAAALLKTCMQDFFEKYVEGLKKQLMKK